MNQEMNAALHDAYAAAYDNQVQAYDCHITDVLFGLCYEYLQSGQSVLDLGIGSGLLAVLFAKAGLKVSGMDFSPAMLEICRSKRVAADLKQQDLQQVPWPYPSGGFDHLFCCGVLHFIPDLEVVFDEAKRIVREGGVFAFTTRVSTSLKNRSQKYDRQDLGGFEIFSHSSDYLASLLEQHSFIRLKTQNALLGKIFSISGLFKRNKPSSTSQQMRSKHLEVALSPSCITLLFISRAVFQCTNIMMMLFQGLFLERSLPPFIVPGTV